MIRLILLVAFISNSLFAQKQLGETQTVYINYPDYTVKASVFSEFKKVSTKDTLTYHWYASNKILKTQGGFDGKLLNGGYTSFYLTNNLREKGNFKNGLKVGTWSTWFENGKLKETSCWKMGVKNGELKQFDEKGNPKLILNYKNGQLNGDYIQYSKDTILLKKKFKNGQEVTPKPKKIKTNGKSVNDSVSSEKSLEKKSEKKSKESFFKKKSKNSSSSGESGKEQSDNPKQENTPSQASDK
jgi:hypothetical protein